MTERVEGVDVGAFAVSELTDHAEACCRAGQGWLLAQHVAHGAGDPLSLGWIARQFPWEPLSWPVAWCDLPRMDTGDCGLHAAIAEHCIRGCQVAARRVQLVLAYGRTELDHWRALWSDRGVDARWIGRGHCYHEAVAVGDGHIRVLDPTEPVEWAGASAARVVAMRINGAAADGPLVWEGRCLPVGHWVSLGDDSSLTGRRVM